MMGALHPVPINIRLFLGTSHFIAARTVQRSTRACAAAQVASRARQLSARPLAVTVLGGLNNRIRNSG
eukprot:343287-Pleurochrysis_carterae.AAC.3